MKKPQSKFDTHQFNQYVYHIDHQRNRFENQLLPFGLVIVGIVIIYFGLRLL